MSKRKLILIGVFVFILLLVILALVLPKKDRGDGGGNGENFIADFFSFNRDRGENGGGGGNESFVSEPNKEEQAKLKLEKVSSVPVAGFGIFMSERFAEITPEEVASVDLGSGLNTVPVAPPTEFVPILRYVDKVTGNIFQTPADKLDERKISTTIVPGVREAYFAGYGESVIMRYLKQDEVTIATFVGALPKYTLGGDTEIGDIKGSFLPENIVSLSVSPEGNIFYLAKDGDGIAGVTANYLGNNKVQVFDSPFTEWLSEWSSANKISINTKPSAGVPGYVYAINPKSKTFNKILGGINGITTLFSKDGGLVLYNSENLNLNISDTENSYSENLRVKTLPEKCVWGKTNETMYCAVPKSTESSTYPDSWYQGEISFSDQIWKIDLVNKTEIAILDPYDVVGEEIDATNLTLDQDGKYLFFINKKDSYLWKLELSD